MEINRVKSTTPVKQEEKKSIGQKKDFSQSFNFAREQKNGEDLKKLMDNIKKKGDRLAVTKSYSDVKAYKEMIREYLKSILNYMYNTKKDISFWQTQYFLTVDIIDEKLEELTKVLMSEEKININIASTVDEITGLVVDMYK